MKFKTYLLALLMGFSAPMFAATNKHMHDNAQNMTAESEKKSNAHAQTKMGWPGYCEIEIINHSYNDVRVYGVFDDGVPLQPFTVYSFESPHYISLYYYGYCHDGMNLYVDTMYGSSVFSGYVSRYSTLRIVPSLFGAKLQAKVQAK